MNNSEDMRFWINKTKQFDGNDRLWEYVRLSPEQTGIPTDIFLDDNQEYLTNNHELWAYVRDNNGTLVPVTISEKPMFKKVITIEIECLKKIVEFIKLNQRLIKKLADGKIELTVLCSILKNVSAVEKQFVYEMATLSPQKSKLPTTLWLDDDKRYLPHAPRIKFRADKQNNDTNNDPSMEIKNPDKIHNMNKCDLTTKEINHIKLFIKANEKELLDLADHLITQTQFISNMKIVDQNGNIENNNEIAVGKMINGFAIARKSQKYNYINNEGDFLFNDFTLDYAENFMIYKDMLIAFVGQNDTYFYIDNTGKQIQI